MPGGESAHRWTSGKGAVLRTLAIVNQKGGCGKTTTAINLSAVFAQRGLRTLLVDMDPQSHCATGLGVPEEGIDLSTGDALLRADSDDLDPRSVLWEVGGKLDLLPSTMRLAALEAPGGGLHELPDRDRRLSRLLERFAGRYDRCLIDCPPTIGLLTFNALRAAREALIPVETGFFALRGADKQWRTIRQLIERIGRPIACHLVPTLYKSESALSTDILAALRRQFGGQVLPVIIHDYEVVKEAASFGQPVIEYAPQSKAREDFERLADWLEAHPPQPMVQIEVGAGPHHAAPATVAAAGRPDIRVKDSMPPVPVAQGRAAELARRVRQLQADRAAEGAAVGPAAEGLASSLEPAGPGFGVSATSRGVRFAQPGGDGSQSMFIAGDFNRWSATATPLPYDPRENVYHTLVEIPPGRYQYRLVIDGRWQADRHNQRRQVNEYDEPNSVLVVPEGQEAS